MQKRSRLLYSLLALAVLILGGCSSHAPMPSGSLANSRVVVAQLNDQLGRWHGTPYRYGGLSRNGIDCSGFVFRTFRDRFGVILPRTTAEQTEVGTKVSRKELLPGDLVFFKTGAGENGLHVGIYDSGDAFIHASTSRGVVRSSLDNEYWRKTYWQARRI
ncbi:NlpC/P60 family protein [Rouxiella badensis]|jgi:probable lipoprotein NlpC|uniref:Endopeptidase n=1 Tax=Rouxiella badensis TaxID=1646377 RepID=A0A1X0WD92_9GAMM|nr:NlpC/P60 family protein [Rouxiella badensis]MCC3701382.1 NlpC/P60 family protein [Rouxiella badensis]MCC3717809.1 NlpC/P60 family protein [Rouxiella badensis]MCC3727247.1 NlpC/P60 family protein [Rouxiella badensis]MCC3735060.1 NlpC/P60 family protein [Rouxiella badensis]MCC3739152.1 NlpC/P60 family protein [Rouxiella badensis]